MGRNIVLPKMNNLYENFEKWWMTIFGSPTKIWISELKDGYAVWKWWVGEQKVA